MCCKNEFYEFQFLLLFVHSRGLNVLDLQKDSWFASNFEHWNFAINEACSKINILTIQIIVFPLWFFKNKKIEFKALATHLNGSQCFSPSISKWLLVKISIYHIFMVNSF